MSGNDPNKMVVRSEIAVDSLGNAHITWTAQEISTTIRDIYYSKITSSGSIAVDYLKLSNSNGSVHWGAGIEVDANEDVHVAYAQFTVYDDPENKYHVYYTKLDNNGGVLIPYSQLTVQDAPMGGPGLGLDQNGDAHMIWADGRESVPFSPWKAYYIKVCPDTDEDGDGWTISEGDCNDSDPNINPDATEVCDGVDNNCDGNVDEGLINAYYNDNDGDGYGNPDVTLEDCTVPSYYVTDNTDCNDYNAGINPGTTEVCDGVDNNCDGNVDESVTNTYYLDADGDGYGDLNITLEDCSVPSGYAANSTDCDDTDTSINPGATEVCDGVDNSCDGNVDESVTNTYYRDADGDGYGDPNNTVVDCSAPSGYVTDDTDCDDADPGINPAACDIKSNGTDEDCDGSDRTKGKACEGGSSGDPEICDDGLDNDGDGDTDCDDRDCRKDSACDGGSTDETEGKGQTCSDGVDNDGDGQVDCADSDCSRNRACR